MWEPISVENRVMVVTNPNQFANGQASGPFALSLAWCDFRQQEDSVNHNLHAAMADVLATCVY
eukprot:scaffold618136_cov15-Prasinocladus_malaysianus.AAC.1